MMLLLGRLPHGVVTRVLGEYHRVLGMLMLVVFGS